MRRYTVTNVEATPGIEGPQIVLTWDIPSETGVSKLKVLRKRGSYPADENDGSEVLTDLTLSHSSVVDYGILPNVSWHYRVFTFYTASSSWQDSTFYAIGDRIIPTTPNGFFYECVQEGTSAGAEPIWPETIEDTVSDGSVIWRCQNTNEVWEYRSPETDASAFAWNSEYLTHLFFRNLPQLHQTEDTRDNQLRLSRQADDDHLGVYRAYHEDGTVDRGQLERFLMIFGSLASRIKGGIDFLPKLLSIDECPPQYLTNLASLLGYRLDDRLTIDRQRASLRNAINVYGRKGTQEGLEILLRGAVGVGLTYVDPMSKHVMISNRLEKTSAVFKYDGWQASTAYLVGDIVVPSDDFGAVGKIFECVEAGTSAASEPLWVEPWYPSKDYLVGDAIVPSQLGYAAGTFSRTSGDISLLADGTLSFQEEDLTYITDLNDETFNGITLIIRPEDEVATNYYDVSGKGLYLVGASATDIPIKYIETDLEQDHVQGFLLEGDETGEFSTGVAFDVGYPDIFDQDPNGFIYVCKEAGTSSATSPTWIEGVEVEVEDNDVVWESTTPRSSNLGLFHQDGTVKWEITYRLDMYDWPNDTTGHLWEIPQFDEYDRVTKEAELYSFEILRLWFILVGDETVTEDELERLSKLMREFMPVDMRYVVRIEGP